MKRRWREILIGFFGCIFLGLLPVPVVYGRIFEATAVSTPSAATGQTAPFNIHGAIVYVRPDDKFIYDAACIAVSGSLAIAIGLAFLLGRRSKDAGATD